MWKFPGNPCPFLEGKAHCSIYELRPITCRAFPFIGMSYTVLSKRAKKKTIEFQRECPQSMALLDIIIYPRVAELLALTIAFTRSQRDELTALIESHEEPQ